MNVLRQAIVILLILLAPMLMLYPLWFNPVSAGEDDVVYYYPLRKMVGQALRQGHWPIHNTLEATGVPLMADPQSAVMHPTTWLFAVMDAKLAYTLSVFAAFSLSGGGAYLYLRRLGLVRSASAFGAVAFMFCGFMVGHRVHLSLISAAATLPWGLWCIEGLRSTKGEGRDRRSRLNDAGARLCAGLAIVPVAVLAITAGHWPTLIHMGLIWFVYLMLRARPLPTSLLLAVAALALAAAIAWPQIDATRQLMAQVTRQRIGYATAGENSFFPLSAVLAFFPFLMGSRTPNFFPQQWWGPWHLCETLGYVGLVTLGLAAAAVWKLYRKKGAAGAVPAGPAAARASRPCIPRPSAEQEDPSRDGCAATDGRGEASALTPLVRAWTWILIGTGVWMLGYYLPTYRLIHMLPVLGVVRCPARMVLAADMALAALAAIAIHALLSDDVGEQLRGALGRAARRMAAVFMPAVMLAALAAIAAGAWVGRLLWPGGVPGLEFFVGGSSDALAALRPWNPAIYVPAALMVVTILALRFFVGCPGRRAAAVVVLLLADLFFVTRFVDVPADPAAAPDPEVSPAAQWLQEHAPRDVPFRVWGLGLTYHDRPAELLLPKTCESLGLASIASYGPFQSPFHAQLLGFRIFGTNRDWADLLRRNYLLSLYNVRYVIAADSKFRQVIESVRIPESPVEPDGPEILTARWRPENAEVRDGVLNLRTPFMWRWSIGWQRVVLQPDTLYRISLEACGPEGGAANFLRAEFFRMFGKWGYYTADELGMSVYPEQMGSDWRHFDWTFRTPGDLSGEVYIRVFTMSERPIEVRNISLRQSRCPVPLDLTGRLKAGEAVYVNCTPQGLPPRRPGADPVYIYENRLFGPPMPRREPTPRDVESLRSLWRTGAGGGIPLTPDVSVVVRRGPQRSVWLVMLPAVVVYVVLLGGLVLLRYWAEREVQKPADA